MTTVKLARADKAKKLKDTLTFAETLQINLEKKQPALSRLAELKAYVRDFPTNIGGVAASKYEELDMHGTALWNLTTRLKRGLQNDAELEGLCYDSVRIQKVALKAAKYCLEQKQLDSALKVLERAADYEEELAKPASYLTPEDAALHGRLSAEYFILRTTLSWRQSRLDIAEHMFRKAALEGRHLDPNTAETFSDLLFEIGKHQLETKQYELAVKWLERSYDLLLRQDLERLSSDAGELRISIIQSTVKALLGLQSEEARKKAWSLVNLLENDFGDKLIVLLMKLELVAAEPLFEGQGFYDVLQRIMRTIVLTEVNFKMVIGYIHKLKGRSAELACKALDDLLLTRMFTTGNDDWIEKVVITRLWITTSSLDRDNVRDSLRKVLDAVTSNAVKSLSARATHAAQTLLWKRIESNYSQQDFASAESWCRLSLHGVFQAAGELNTAKIARKVIQCALARHDAACAREMYNQMSDAGRAMPMTKYLMFKVAVRGGDVDLAAECLDAVSHGSSSDATLLYACVLDAQQAGDKLQVAAALQKVLAKYNYGAPSGVHLPALLRCAARLLIQELGDPKSTTWDTTDGICKLFEGAASQARQSRRDPSNQVFTIAELDWFSRNSYNLSLKSCADWNPKQTLRLLKACIKFMDLYPKDMDAATMADLSLRRMFCDFLCACLIVVIARAEDVIEDQLQQYLDLRSHVNDFRNRVADQLARLEGGARSDLLHKNSTLLSFDFEAAVRLKAWDDLGQIIEEGAACGESKMYEIFADNLLCSQAPTATMVALLQNIVNATWRLEYSDIAKLSRWIRCLFQIALPSDIKIAEHILDQMQNVAEGAKTSGKLYPTEELEWIATTTFNRAVDFFCASEDTACKRWAEKALSIAALSDDSGDLHRTLQDKYLSLSWES